MWCIQDIHPSADALHRLTHVCRFCIYTKCMHTAFVAQISNVFDIGSNWVKLLLLPCEFDISISQLYNIILCKSSILFNMLCKYSV